MRDVDINGRWTLTLPDDRAAQWAQWGGRWEVERLDATAAAVQRAEERSTAPPVVYDIGAERGDLPCLWATWGARVVLVEPSVGMWPTIRAIFEANNMAERVAGCFVGFAADAIPASRRALTAGPWPSATRQAAITEPGFGHLNESGSQPVCTIDWLAAELDTPPDIITVDVEGSELAVMRGAARCLDQHRPDVLISVHPDFMVDRYRTSPALLGAYMSAAGYVASRLACDHEEHFIYIPEERS